ncbi:MAG TPA: formimidoylglutamase [Candidatus Limnocylindrales bacterium]|nr:formimidoylglutamase [Candidatus Limnocylindrales bacterium]
MSREELFHATERPAAELFYQRGDASDRRLGEVVRSAPNAYAEAGVVLLGCPQDEGVRRNGGRIGAALAPDAVRRCLYKLTVNQLEGLHLFDLGNTHLGGTLEATHDRQRDIACQVIADGKTLIVLGGGNDLSYPDCAGLADAAGRVLAFNVDAHYDVRADAVRNSGTPYRQLLEEGVLQPGVFYEIGSQPFANSPVYTRYLQDKGAHIIPLAQLLADGVTETFERILEQMQPAAVFWGLDMDVVRAADAPGVSAPNPTGLAGDDLCAIAAIAGGFAQTRLLELAEVNPNYDLDQRTCRLAAVAIWSFLAAREGTA